VKKSKEITIHIISGVIIFCLFFFQTNCGPKQQELKDPKAYYEQGENHADAGEYEKSIQYQHGQALKYEMKTKCQGVKKITKNLRVFMSPWHKKSCDNQCYLRQLDRISESKLSC